MFSLFWFLDLGDIGEQHDLAAGAREVEPRGVPSPDCSPALMAHVAQHERQRLAQHAQDEEPRADSACSPRTGRTDALAAGQACAGGGSSRALASAARKQGRTRRGERRRVI